VKSNKFLDTLKSHNRQVKNARLRTVDVMYADCHDLAGNQLL